MEINQEALIEKRLNLIAKLALLFQFSALIVLALILYYQPVTYKKIGFNFALMALLFTFIIARIYIYTGKKLEETKTFSPEEGESRKKEYAIRFFCPYFFWGAIACFFQI